MKIIVRPDLGGRIDSIFDRRTHREWLYHPSTYQPDKTRQLSLGANFDENWSGGWDEIFPNDASGDFQGHQLVDHGEFWSQNWEVIEQNSLGVTMVYRCQTVPVLAEKTILLNPHRAEASIKYIFKNVSQQALPFLFKMHAALAVEENDEILLPNCLMEPVDLGFSQWIGQNQKTKFPKAFDREGKEIDVRRVPSPSSGLQEFYYCSDLEEGQCGIFNQKSQSALMMKFETSHFPFVWNFQSYGGWNDHFMLVLEPCTTKPWDLKKAMENQTCAVLGPGETQERFLKFFIEKR